MANEISASVQLAVSKGGVTLSGTGNAQQDMAGEDMVHTTQIIGTSAEALTLIDLSGTPAYILIKNLDATNYVELALDSGMVNKFAKILAGKPMLFPPTTGTIYAQANTAAVRVEVLATEL